MRIIAYTTVFQQPTEKNKKKDYDNRHGNSNLSDL